jgi:kumamolisin
MKNTPKLIEVRGSRKDPLVNAPTVGRADPGEHAEVTVLLRRRPGANVPATLGMKRAPPLSIEELELQHGASPADIRAVEEFAQSHSLTVVQVNPGQRTVILAGTVGDLSQAFSTELNMQQTPKGVFRTRSGPIYVPEGLGPIVEGVFGLDNRPAASPKFRRLGVMPHSGGMSYTPTEVAAAYQFPQDADGTGQCIAVLELGGGFKQVDLETYFSSLGVTPAPSVLAAGVDGGKNAPTGDPSGPDGEVMLDIEVAGAVAPRATIAVYFAPNTDRGFLDVLLLAMHDKAHRPSVVSISWGGPESHWTQQALDGFNQALQDAGMLGITVCCAAGDGGSSDGGSDGLAHADFPASSPFALACGGTRLETDGGGAGTETVWNNGADGATGGGVSDYFDLPAWQRDARIPPSANPGHRVGRGLPDVAGNADPATGYQTRVDGQVGVIGGTSAVAPLVAALLALLNQKLGSRIGYFNPALYTTAAIRNAFRDVTQGSNGAYAAAPGWDACTGWGSPNGAKLLAALGG